MLPAPGCSWLLLAASGGSWLLWQGQLSPPAGQLAAPTAPWRAGRSMERREFRLRQASCQLQQASCTMLWPQMPLLRERGGPHTPPRAPPPKSEMSIAHYSPRRGTPRFFSDLAAAAIVNLLSLSTAHHNAQSAPPKRSTRMCALPSNANATLANPPLLL